MVPEIVVENEDTVRFLLGDCLEFFRLPHPEGCPCDMCERRQEHREGRHDLVGDNRCPECLEKRRRMFREAREHERARSREEERP